MSVEESEQAGDRPRRGERPRPGEECRGGVGVRGPESPRRLPSEVSPVRPELLSWTPLSVSDRAALRGERKGESRLAGNWQKRGNVTRPTCPFSQEAFLSPSLAECSPLGKVYHSLSFTVLTASHGFHGARQRSTAAKVKGPTHFQFIPGSQGLWRGTELVGRPCVGCNLPVLGPSASAAAPLHPQCPGLPAPGAAETPSDKKGWSQSRQRMKSRLPAPLG